MYVTLLLSYLRLARHALWRAAGARFDVGPASLPASWHALRTALDSKISRAVDGEGNV